LSLAVIPYSSPAIRVEGDKSMLKATRYFFVLLTLLSVLVSGQMVFAGEQLQPITSLAVSIQTEPAESISPQSAVLLNRASDISMNLKGDGKTTSTVDVQLSNSSAKEKTLIIPAGQVFLSSGKTQDMMSAKDTVVSVPPESTIVKTIESFCISPKSVPPPGESSQYSVGADPHPAMSKDFLSIINTADELQDSGHFDGLLIPEERRSHTIAQLAIWMQTADLTGKPDDQVNPTTIEKDLLTTAGVSRESLSNKQQENLDDAIFNIFMAADMTGKQGVKKPEETADDWDTYDNSTIVCAQDPAPAEDNKDDSQSDQTGEKEQPTKKKETTTTTKDEKGTTTQTTCVGKTKVKEVVTTKYGKVTTTEFYPNGKPKEKVTTYPKTYTKESTTTTFYKSGNKETEETRYRPKRVEGENTEEMTQTETKTFNDDPKNTSNGKEVTQETTRVYTGFVRGRKKITVTTTKYGYTKEGTKFVKEQTRVTEEYTDFDEFSATKGKRTTKTRTKKGPGEKFKNKPTKVEPFDPKSQGQLPSP